MLASIFHGLAIILHNSCHLSDRDRSGRQAVSREIISCWQPARVPKSNSDASLSCFVHASLIYRCRNGSLAHGFSAKCVSALMHSILNRCMLRCCTACKWCDATCTSNHASRIGNVISEICLALTSLPCRGREFGTGPSCVT